MALDGVARGLDQLQVSSPFLRRVHDQQVARGAGLLVEFMVDAGNELGLHVAVVDQPVDFIAMLFRPTLAVAMIASIRASSAMKAAPRRVPMRRFAKKSLVNPLVEVSIVSYGTELKNF